MNLWHHWNWIDDIQSKKSMVFVLERNETSNISWTYDITEIELMTYNRRNPCVFVLERNETSWLLEIAKHCVEYVYNHDIRLTIVLKVLTCYEPSPIVLWLSL